MFKGLNKIMKKLMMFDSKLGYRMGLGGANQVEKI